MKKLFCIVLVLILALGLVACQSAPATETVSTTDPSAVVETSTALASASTEVTETGYQGEEKTLIMNVGCTETNADGKGMQLLKDYVEEKTNGKVKIDLYFNASLFPSDQDIPEVNAGNLDLINTGAGQLADYMPELGMLNSAYLFKSYEHMMAFFASDAGQALFDKIAENAGVRVLGAHCVGFRCVNINVDRKIKSRADLADIKLRMANSESWQFMGKALGANPVPVNFPDLYLSLQTGAVDGQDNPVATIKGSSFYEVTKSVTMTKHVVYFSWIAISESTWESISPELKKVIQDGVNAANKYITETSMTAQEDDIAFLKEKGMTVYELTDEELASYRQEVINYYLADQNAIAKWDMDLYQTIQDMA